MQLLRVLTREEADVLLVDWRFWARPDQLPPPGNWRLWWMRAGRGAGKTRAGAEWVMDCVRRGTYGRFHLISRTGPAATDEMLEGPGGILTNSPNDFRPVHQPSKHKLTWPNGAVALIYSADEPDRLRGPQTEAAWLDEVGAWRYQRQAWDMAMLGLRLGDNPRACVTSTPQVTPIIKELLSRKDVAITRASTYDNRAHLAPGFFEDIVSRYEGTRLGRQEIYAELLEDNPGALWKREYIEDNRQTYVPEDLHMVFVGVDPSGSIEEGSSEAGIVAAGANRSGHIYILDDRSLRTTPQGWATEAVALYNLYSADAIVAERNYGGLMVKATIEAVDSTVPVRLVQATRGKAIRAEPIAARYEKNLVHHIGSFPILEDQMTSWSPLEKGPSPDRLDALVWACTELLGLLRGSGATASSGKSSRAPDITRQSSLRSRVAGY